ncbi:DNA alkylation repair protein [Planctobacterium marinum]|uniref:DNA alkylation repair protein n=1 Tax=Planctobacterium marinum TaxID=1631968 RepID=A0AA48HGW6_9ALTE|nr:hypothetical protein MACH26_22190 [Planctobacterium marinum]
MPEPFKEKFNVALITALAETIQDRFPEFTAENFINSAIKDLDSLELKQRSMQITEALHQCLPIDFNHFAEIIRAILHPDDNMDMNLARVEKEGVRGWAIMPLADLVAIRAIPEYFDEGLILLSELTKRFSAEFAIRDFILMDLSKAFTTITQWTTSDNEHLRRLASEGARPRLPWGKQLPDLIRDPQPLMPILESLLDDDSEYVRRSVANNLNDIAKDNPGFVIDFVACHIATDNRQRMRLLRHACRTLIKQGEPQILALFGYTRFTGNTVLTLDTEQVSWGGVVSATLNLSSNSRDNQSLMIDYVVWHQKVNGKLAPKVFKWKVIDTWNGASLTLTKKHSFKPVTTRRYYPGLHKIQVQINGEVFDEVSFTLMSDKH